MNDFTLPGWLVFTAAPLAAIGLVVVILGAIAILDPDEDY